MLQQAMYFKLVKHSHSYIDNMQKRSYKREFVDKVKQKFNDLQPIKKDNNNSTSKQCDDKGSKVCNSARLVVRN